MRQLPRVPALLARRQRRAVQQCWVEQESEYWSAFGLLQFLPDYSREVLVLYLERPAQKQAFALPHTGRF